MRNEEPWSVVVEEKEKAEEPRDGWEMPENPGHDCESPDVVPEAQLHGNKWELVWSCDGCHHYVGKIEWPFEDDQYASEDLLRKIGFRITNSQEE